LEQTHLSRQVRGWKYAEKPTLFPKSVKSFLQSAKICLLALLLAPIFLLLLWSGAFLSAHDWMFQLNARWFRQTPEVFDAMHYGGLGRYKLAIWLLNFAPCVALRIVGRGRQPAELCRADLRE